jgi:hypothetical protein
VGAVVLTEMGRNKIAIAVLVAGLVMTAVAWIVGIVLVVRLLV